MSLDTMLRTISVEAGHFYQDAFDEGDAALAGRFKVLRPYVDCILDRYSGGSTVFLFDDYHNRPRNGVSPADMLSRIRYAAEEAELSIDYIAREAACVALAPAALALLQERAVVRETSSSGWLVNETQSDFKHKVGQLDVELYSRYKRDGQISWACPLLASVWQLLRTGRMTHELWEPQLVENIEEENWRHWADVPALIQCSPNASPFVNDESFSALPTSYMEVEIAVSSIVRTLTNDKPLLQQYSFIPEI